MNKKVALVLGSFALLVTSAFADTNDPDIHLLSRRIEIKQQAQGAADAYDLIHQGMSQVQSDALMASEMLNPMYNQRNYIGENLLTLDAAATARFETAKTRMYEAIPIVKA